MVSKTLTGFKEFLLRGNLVELAVAVIMATSFGAVVKSFTDLLLDVIGKLGGVPDFSKASLLGISFGAFLSALLAFLLTGFVVYFFVITPYNKFSEPPQEGRSRRCRLHRGPARGDPRSAQGAERAATAVGSSRTDPPLVRTASAAVMGRPIRLQPTFVVRQRPVRHHWPGVRRQRTELGQQRGPHGRELSGTQAPSELIRDGHRPGSRRPRLRHSGAQGLDAAEVGDQLRHPRRPGFGKVTDRGAQQRVRQCRVPSPIRLLGGHRRESRVARSMSSPAANNVGRVTLVGL